MKSLDLDLDLHLQKKQDSKIKTNVHTKFKKKYFIMNVKPFILICL